MICSIVPISFSRTMAMLVNSRRDQADHDDNHAGDVEVAADEVLVERCPGAEIESPRRLHGPFETIERRE